MSDVWSRLAHAAAHPGDQRGDRLGKENVARVVIIAGHARTLGDVDAADDRQNRKRQGERQIIA